MIDSMCGILKCVGSIYETYYNEWKNIDCKFCNNLKKNQPIKILIPNNKLHTKHIIILIFNSMLL